MNFTAEQLQDAFLSGVVTGRFDKSNLGVVNQADLELERETVEKEYGPYWPGELLMAGYDDEDQKVAALEHAGWLRKQEEVACMKQITVTVYESKELPGAFSCEHCRCINGSTKTGDVVLCQECLALVDDGAEIVKTPNADWIYALAKGETQCAQQQQGEAK